MGPHSWVATSSSSSESLDPCLIADGEYGMPKQCYCGGEVFLETSNAPEDAGRRYFTCRRRDRDGYHIRKWWDNVIHDELEILHSDIRSLELSSQSCGKAEQAIKEITTLWVDVCVAEKAIADQKNDIVKMKEAIADQKEDFVKIKEAIADQKEDFVKIKEAIADQKEDFVKMKEDLDKKQRTVEITFLVAAFVMFLGLFIIWFK